MQNSQSSILITGGAGFIGSTFVRQWLTHESSLVVNLDNFTYAGNPESLEGIRKHPKHHVITGDIGNEKLVEHLLEVHRPSAILHLAAETHVDRSIANPGPFAETNVLGTCVLLHAANRYWQSLSGHARDAFRFLLVSTDEVFGSAQPNQVFTTDSPLAPNSPYAATKAAGEMLAHAFQKTYGFPLLLVNPTNNYGPRQCPEKFIPKMILSAMTNRPLSLYGDGRNQRDWLHVDDCCHALRCILNQGKLGSRYLIGTNECQSNLRIAQLICDLVDAVSLQNTPLVPEKKGPNRVPKNDNEHAGHSLGRRQSIRFIPDRPGHDRRYAIDPGRLQSELGWKPKISLEKGLLATVQWYFQNNSWTQQALKRL